MGPNEGSAEGNEVRDVADSGAGSVASLAAPEVRNRGQIAEMILPVGWVEAPPRTFSGALGTRSLRVIHPPETLDVHLEFYYRGLPMSEAAGTNFLRVLERPPHNLDTDEWSSLSELAWDRDDPNDFDLFSARTEDWNGRRVLVVEGRYVQIQEDNLEMFVDAVGDGRVVQEILYQAPIDVYIKYLRIVEDSLKSIRWA